MEGKSSGKSWYCRIYAMNEALFGQSEENLSTILDDTELELNIDFSNCYLLLLGLPRRFYVQRLGVTRGDIRYFRDQVLMALVTKCAREMGFRFEVSILNYDYSKRFVLAVSPEDPAHFDVMALAQRLWQSLDAQYALKKPDRSAAERNIVAVSSVIREYGAYQRAFEELRRLYDKMFFLREEDVLTWETAMKKHVPCSMVELERLLALISDSLYLRDVQGIRMQLSDLMHQIKAAQDIPLCREMMVLLKRRISDMCLIAGVAWEQEDEQIFDLDRYLCIEEAFEEIDVLLQKLFSASHIPKLRPDGVTVRAAVYIRKNYYRPLDLQCIADYLNVNPSYLSHTFKTEMCVGITQYIFGIRMEQAQRLLRETDRKVSQIAQEVGIGDSRYFNTVFKRHTGKTPTEYREYKRI